MISHRPLPWLFILCVSLLLNFPLIAETVSPLSPPLNDPTRLAELPDGSVMIATRSGTILTWSPTADTKQPPRVWLDLSATTTTTGQAGLLGLAVDPQFPVNGFVYAVQSYTEADGQLNLRLLRLLQKASSGSLNKILRDKIPSGAENPGGVLEFGPDGQLYLGVGDGGVAAIEVSPATGRGVLLRLSPEGTIPSDNPQPDSAVWAWGLRDLRGLAWQTDSGRLYGLDRGPVIPRGTMDEMDWLEPSKNYGWPQYLGRDRGPGIEKPVTYCASGHSWIPGGAVIATSGAWKGSLLFTGAGAGVLYRLILDSKNPVKINFFEELIGGALGPLVDIAQGPTPGTYYLLSKDKLYLVTDAD